MGLLGPESDFAAGAKRIVCNSSERLFCPQSRRSVCYPVWLAQLTISDRSPYLTLLSKRAAKRCMCVGFFVGRLSDGNSYHRSNICSNGRGKRITSKHLLQHSL